MRGCRKSAGAEFIYDALDLIIRSQIARNAQILCCIDYFSYVRDDIRFDFYAGAIFQRVLSKKLDVQFSHKG